MAKQFKEVALEMFTDAVRDGRIKPDGMPESFNAVNSDATATYRLQKPGKGFSEWFKKEDSSKNKK